MAETGEVLLQVIGIVAGEVEEFFKCMLLA